LFDVSGGSFEYSGPGTFAVQAPTNFGTLTLNNGNLTLYNTVEFAQSVNIPSGIAISTVGTAAVSMKNGVTGAGMINAAGSTLVLGGVSVTGYLNAIGGNVTIQSASSIGTVTLAGGHLFFQAALTATQLNLLAGILSGSNGVSATNFYLKGRGTVLDASVSIATEGYIGGSSLITFTKNGQLTVAAAATLNIPASGSLVINGAVGAPGFSNNGVTKISGTFQTQNINVIGVGAFNVSSKLKVSSATFNTNSVNLSGSGVFKGTNSNINVIAIVASTSVLGTIGVYSFQCPHQCNSVSTASTPTSAFSFTVASTSKH